MCFDRQIARLMAAMILAIIAYVAPSAAQAHEGHGGHGRHMAAAQPQPKAAAAKPTVRAAAPTWSKVVTTAVEAAYIAPTGDACCRPGCKTRCCGTMSCCATGVLSGSDALVPSLFRTGTQIPGDVSGRVGTAPETLPKPPRTLA
ncbi:hypothetical protein ADL19_30305 [Streptomyces purpurogeneiscleroticus]|nr:hypothetical protein ADL19_30305 [Streptomyces purpurogeneiscleroticus]